jgi:hypothetical protein
VINQHYVFITLEIFCVVKDQKAFLNAATESTMYVNRFLLNPNLEIIIRGLS